VSLQRGIGISIARLTSSPGLGAQNICPKQFASELISRLEEKDGRLSSSQLSAAT
jgi:hypothetical protein